MEMSSATLLVSFAVRSARTEELVKEGRMRTIVTLFTFSFALAAVDAHASLITNGSFENTSNSFVGDANHVDALPSGSSAIPGWTTTNGVPTAWIENGNPYGISASDGQFFLDLTSYSNVGTYGGVSQSFSTTAGNNYVVTFDLGYGGASGAFRGPVSLRVTAGASSGTFTSAAGSPNPAVWDHETFHFTAVSGTTQLSLIGLSTTGGEYIGLDHVDVEPGAPGTVPEPASCALFVLGSCLFAGPALFRKHK
jgi:hypothetical protein